MLNSVSQNLAYTAQDITKSKIKDNIKSENTENKGDVKTSTLSSKASEIAEKIANGTYKIDLKASATSIANELLND